jgi:hypothetical protein
MEHVFVTLENGRDFSEADLAVYSLGRLACEDFFEVMVVAEHGLGIAGLKLMRGLYERAITAEYISKGLIAILVKVGNWREQPVALRLRFRLASDHVPARFYRCLPGGGAELIVDLVGHGVLLPHQSSLRFPTPARQYCASVADKCEEKAIRSP